MMLQTLQKCNGASEVSALVIGLGRDMKPDRIAHKNCSNIQLSLTLKHHFLRLILHTAEP